MKEYIARITLKAKLNKNEEKVEKIEHSIIDLFENKTNVKRIWCLGKNLSEKHNTGLQIKIVFTARRRNAELLRKELKKSRYISASSINLNKSTNILFSLLDKSKNLVKKDTTPEISLKRSDRRTVYMLISKNVKLPFAESQILCVSDDKSKLFATAFRKIQEYIYVKGYRTLKSFQAISEVEKELQKTWRVQFALADNYNVVQELTVCERTLI